MQAETWALLKGKWLVRLFAATLLLQGAVSFVDRLLTEAFAVRQIHPFGEFLEKKAQAWFAGMDYVLPSPSDYGWMLGGFCLKSFLVLVFSAVATFGLMSLFLKICADDDSRWLSSAFGGFSRPFEATGLLVLMNLKVFLWALLFLVPGIVAMYRYRATWFLKVEHPEMSASDCLSASAKLMKGFKRKAFRLDLVFFGWIFLSSLVFGMGCLLARVFSNALGGFLSFLVGAVGLYYVLKASFGFAVSHAVFYREVAGLPHEGP